MSTHPDAPRIIQSNDVAGIIITVAEKVHPGEFVTLDLRYGIADALWAAGYRKVEAAPSDTDRFKPTHRVRERGTEAWIEVRADGTEPQTYYDRDGTTIYAGIWFQHMEVEPHRVTIIRNAVWKVLWNASNYPRKVTPHMLGQDITPLRDKVTDAVVAALGGGDHAE